LIFSSCNDGACSCTNFTAPNGQVCTATCTEGQTCDLGGTACKVVCREGARCVVRGDCSCEGAGCTVCRE
jgi:hypothetical protein